MLSNRKKMLRYTLMGVAFGTFSGLSAVIISLTVPGAYAAIGAGGIAGISLGICTTFSLSGFFVGIISSKDKDIKSDEGLQGRRHSTAETLNAVILGPQDNQILPQDTIFNRSPNSNVRNLELMENDIDFSNRQSKNTISDKTTYLPGQIDETPSKTPEILTSDNLKENSLIDKIKEI